MKNKKLIIGAVIFAALAGFSGWFIYRDFLQGRPLKESSKVELSENDSQISPEERQAAP